MTEAEWLKCCDDPTVMLYHMPGWPTPRQQRHFELACCRLFGKALPKKSARLVELGEFFVDGQIDLQEVKAACEAEQDRLGDRAVSWLLSPEESVLRVATNLAHADQSRPDTHIARSTVDLAMQAQPPRPGAAFDSNRYHRLYRSFRQDVATILHDILGNPWQKSTVQPHLLVWEGGTVVRLAGAIYEQRRYADLPILADALEEAGCSDGRVLDHCRKPGTHVRGCWVLDAILGKT
jgi:hypothetical protein